MKPHIGNKMIIIILLYGILYVTYYIYDPLHMHWATQT